MKKLGKRNNVNSNTIQAFATCTCSCYCSCTCGVSIAYTTAYNTKHNSGYTTTSLRMMAK